MVAVFSQFPDIEKYYDLVLSSVRSTVVCFLRVEITGSILSCHVPWMTLKTWVVFCLTTDSHITSVCYYS